MSGVNIGGGTQSSSYNHAKLCIICSSSFKSNSEFARHLRECHCTKEGGSYVCKYGLNNVCPSLPLEGVNEADYEQHIARDHLHMPFKGTTGLNGKHGKRESPPDLHQEPNIVQDQHKWTVFKASVFLPAVLNDPSRVKRESDFFTKTWGQDFYEKLDVPPSPNLPNISREHFEKYRCRVSKRYKKHQHKTNQLLQEGPGGETFLQQLEKNRAELQQIPKLFLLQNFTLDNPDTFNAVFPWSQIESSKQSSVQAARGVGGSSSKLLQEKLSHYLDIVEVHIAKQISTKSDAFFQAMTSHDQLQENMSHTCLAIKRLRDRVNTVDECMAKGSLRIIKLSRSRANHISLYNKLKMMATVHQTQPTIQLLLSTSEYVGALDLISTTQEVLAQELAGVHSFRHLGSQLAELEKVIDKMLHEEFAKFVSLDLNRPMTDHCHIEEEEKVVSLVFGMLRKGSYNFVEVYRDEAFTSIRAVVKQTVIEAVSLAETVDTDDNNSSLGDQMRMLDYKGWMLLLQQIFCNILICLQRVKTFHGIISDVIGIAAKKTNIPSPLPSPTDGREKTLAEPEHLHVSVSEDVSDLSLPESDFSKIQAQLSDLLRSVCDHAHDRCVKVIQARAKDGFLERLSSVEFVSLSKKVEAFVNECEAVCGRRSTSLRLSLQSQASRFVNHFHEERKQKLSLILDNERWKQADVPSEFQELVHSVVKTGKLRLLAKSENETEKKPTENLAVGEEYYVVVGTVLMLLKMMIEYCQCVEDIPSAAPELLNRLIELMKIFNSRTCQLVLGAGAVQMVGLKTITTKNLALASRCLQLVVYFIPTVRKHFDEHLMAKNKTMLKHFDQVCKDYQDHINEINNKLVGMMEGVIENHLSRWEVKAPMPSGCFRAVCKQISKMHEAVTEILPQDQTLSLFSSIDKTFLQLVRQQLIKLNVTSNSGPKHGLVTSDLAFYSGTYKTLRGLETLGTTTHVVWDVS